MQCVCVCGIERERTRAEKREYLVKTIVFGYVQSLAL